MQFVSLFVSKSLGSKASGAIAFAILLAVGYGMGRPLLGQVDRKLPQGTNAERPSSQITAASLQALRSPQWADGPQGPIKAGQTVATQSAEPKADKIAQASPDPTSDRKLGQVLEADYQASWYGPGFHGNLTANGEIFDQEALTAAHKELPFDTQLRITNVANGQSVVVRVNDRGPYIDGRELDLSAGAAAAIGGTSMGVIPIQMEILK
jgi:rare lipoprotein A (peptidoglycan hydrolase)